MPCKCYEADAVRFSYVDKTDGSSIPKTNIVSWSWAFNGDDLEDAKANGGSQITLAASPLVP